jgi:tellurite methyltransferase
VSPQGQQTICTPTEPSNLLVRFSDLLPRQGLALDVACGWGRNSLFLARRGLRVLAVDRSREALAQGRELATQADLAVDFVQADLTVFKLPVNSVCLIVCFNYRDPALYLALRSSLRPGGLLIYETYTDEHRHYDARPRNPDHVLAKSELLREFRDWQLIFYREVWINRGVASLVAQKPLTYD